MLLKKKSFLGVAVAGGLAFVCSGVHADPFLPVPPASFLNYHVSTARGLSEEVAQDVVVRARLARHFGMSAAALTSYVRENLVETSLSARQAGRYRVACISPSGREYFVSERLAAGTPVFALAATGQPVLKLACGNPLVATLPPAPPKPVVHKKPALLALSPKTIPATAAPTSEIDDAAFTEQTPVTDSEIDSAAPFVRFAGADQSLSGGKGGFLFPILFGAVGVGVLGGHHGSSPTVSPVASSTPVMPVAPVAPIVPTAPVTPVVPVTPVTPTAPVTPVTPTAPVIPVVPVTPIVPVTPVAPAVPVTPAAPVPEPSSLLLFGLCGGVLIGGLLRARLRSR